MGMSGSTEAAAWSEAATEFAVAWAVGAVEDEDEEDKDREDDDVRVADVNEADDKEAAEDADADEAATE